jgi:hypothetical protein
MVIGNRKELMRFRDRGSGLYSIGHRAKSESKGMEVKKVRS